MLARDGRQSPLTDQTSQTTALKDLLDFLEATDLPPIHWTVPPLGPSLDAIIQPGPSMVLTIVQAYADAIGVAPALRRLDATTQEFVAYRSDALSGRTEMYVAIRTPINCLDVPPDGLTPGTLVAERDWVTLAEVRFLRETAVRSIEQTDFRYARGDQVLMYQQGHRGMPVDAKWWSSLNINEARIVEPDSVEIMEVLSYTSPITAWEDELTRKVELSPLAVSDTDAQILAGPWRPLDDQEPSS